MKAVFWLPPIAAPANAWLVLIAAAIVALCRLLSAHRPLWKTWTSHEPKTSAAIPATTNTA
jgi:hypothetical protein